MADDDKNDATEEQQKGVNDPLTRTDVEAPQVEWGSNGSAGGSEGSEASGEDEGS